MELGLGRDGRGGQSCVSEKCSFCLHTTGKMTRNGRKQRSQLSSASSDGNSPLAKRLNSTESNALSSRPQSHDQLTPTSENTGTVDNSHDKPSIGEICLIPIQTDVARILNENQEIRKDVDELKASPLLNDN